MKIYIIGETRTKEHYEKMENTLLNEGHEVVNILKMFTQLPKLTLDEKTKMSHALIGISDAVFVSSKWKKSHVAKEEVMYALTQNVNVTFEVKEELPFE